MFDEKGQIIIDKEECDMDADDLMMTVLDAGAEDFNEEEDSYEVLTAPEDFSDVRLKMEEAGIPMVSAEVTMIPQTYVDLTKEEDITNIQKTLDLLDEDDDVQDVYHNWNEKIDQSGAWRQSFDRRTTGSVCGLFIYCAKRNNGDTSGALERDVYRSSAKSR